MRIKKKLEQDINELEIALDASNRAKAELEKNIKRYQQQITVSNKIKRCFKRPDFI
jgi:phage shock protein A